MMVSSHATHRPCPICAAHFARTLYSMRFSLPEDSPLPAAYEIVVCESCGVVFADTAGSEQDYACHYTYSSRYEDPTLATGGGGADFDLCRLEDTARMIAEHISMDARVIDVGCGNGGLLRELHEMGFTDLHGMDLAPRCLERVRALGFHGIRGGVGADMPTPTQTYDLIVLSHVLEHLLDPRDALRLLHPWLSQTGRIYVETPDASRYKDYPSVPFYYFDCEHINHFDSVSLDNLARASGYSIVWNGIKTLSLMDGHPYPACYAFLSSAQGEQGLTKNGDMSAALGCYIAICQGNDSVSEATSEAVASGRPIILWGAGSQAQRLLSMPIMSGAKIVAVVDRDSNKHGKQFAGHPIQSPEAGLTALPENCLVVIAAAHVAEGIHKEYLAMGLPYECVIN